MMLGLLIDNMPIDLKDRDYFEFSATVPEGMRQAAEALFFFNPRQGNSINGILATVERTGVPAIMERDGQVWIGVPPGNMQCLFAFDRRVEPQRPAGVLLYGRPAPDVIWISHLAVDPVFTCGNKNRGAGLGCILVEKVREIARSIKGVTKIQLPYRRNCFLPVRVPDHPQATRSTAVENAAPDKTRTG
jgi:hypothetical protein